MSRSNNLLMRARIDDTGAFEAFEISNYSGGGSMKLRTYKAPSGEMFWVLDTSGADRTLVLAEAGDWYCGRDRHDLDELSLEALRLYRTDTGLEDIDRRHRLDYEKRNGVSLLQYLTRAETNDLTMAVGG